MPKQSTGADIDYRGIYANYSGHGEGVRSFKASAPQHFKALADQLQLASFVDVGGGNGLLLRELGRLGMRGAAIDVSPQASAQAREFDLTNDCPALQRQTLAWINQYLVEQPYLVFCLDVLERIGRRDLPAALENLYLLTDEYAMFSISTRPSSDFNLYHATVAPSSIWQKLLKTAGFDVVSRNFPELSERRVYSQRRSTWLCNHWLSLDPYLEAGDNEPQYWLIRKTARSSSAGDRAAELGRLLRTRPATSDIHRSDTTFHFLLGNSGNFTLYQPFWDVLPRANIKVWIRVGANSDINNLHLLTYLGYFRARGIPFQLVQLSQDLDLPITIATPQVLITASESTASAAHTMNLAFVAEAQFRGCPSVVLQHGIWVEDFTNPIVFLSDKVLTWSEEHLRCFQQISSVAPIERPWPRGIIDPGRFSITGCPKFDPYFSSNIVILSELLGDWVTNFCRTVLCTTNFHWHQHRSEGEAQYYLALFSLAINHPEWLFLIKLHPAEFPTEDRLVAKPANVVFLTDLAALCADIRTSDLVQACDLVISSLSTVVLEAALARKPCAVIDTGTSFSYHHAEQYPIDSLPSLADRSLPLASKFADHYYEKTMAGNGLSNCLHEIESLSEHPRALDANTVSNKVLGNMATRYAAELFQQKVRQQKQSNS